jgi:hypothetical protein
VKDLRIEQRRWNPARRDAVGECALHSDSSGRDPSLRYARLLLRCSGAPPAQDDGGEVERIELHPHDDEEATSS